MPYRGFNNRPRPYHARGRGGHPIRFQHRHMGPQHAPSQWCNKCKNYVSNFEKHFEREHALKFWGYQCPHCGLFDSKLDKSFFRRHLAEHMEATDIEVCKVSVKQGYVKAVTCLYCQYKAVNQVAMAIHVSEMHNQVEAYYTKEGAAQVNPEQLPEVQIPVGPGTPEMAALGTAQTSAVGVPTGSTNTTDQQMDTSETEANMVVELGDGWMQKYAQKAAARLTVSHASTPALTTAAPASFGSITSIVPVTTNAGTHQA